MSPRACTRRDFLRRSAALGAGAALAAEGAAAIRALAAARLDPYRPPTDLAIAHGPSPAKNCLAAVDALGGFGRFVRAGDRVVVKPNPVGSSAPERAINTHPDMVEAVVRECLRAGAREVVVLSHDEASGFSANGILDAVRRAGGACKPLSDRKDFRDLLVPRGRVLRRTAIAADVLDGDLFINMPIAKHHAGTQFTGAMKNLMGIVWDRNTFHQTDLHQCIAELSSAVKHDLVIMDANHVLLTNGPAGPGDVLNAGKVIAGIDPVAIDAFSTGLFGWKPEQIPHIQAAYGIGVGEIDVSKLAVKEIEV